MPGQRGLQGQMGQFEPVVENLMAMARTARDAFNRHNPERLEELTKLQTKVSQELKALTKKIEGLPELKRESAPKTLASLHGIVNNLTHMAENTGNLKEPLLKKLKDNILFSEKAVSQTNFLFDNQTGILHSLMDIFKTDNDFLKKYVVEEGRKLIKSCSEFATEHEERLIEGLCAPQAAPIFLAILEKVRAIGQQAVNIVDNLNK